MGDEAMQESFRCFATNKNMCIMFSFNCKIVWAFCNFNMHEQIMLAEHV